MALLGRMHLLQLSLVMVVQVTVLLATPTPTTAQSLLPPQLARPSCPDHCGNLTIPYPFGIGSDCYLDHRFEITCNNSIQPPTAFLKGNVKITNISLYDGEIQILQFAASDCYDAQGNSTERKSLDLSVPPPYTISQTKNVLVVVGCDSLALITGYRRDEKYYMILCSSICDSLDDAMEQKDTCSGVGCIQTKIPSRVKNLSVKLSSVFNHTGVWAFNPCSYAF